MPIAFPPYKRNRSIICDIQMMMTKPFYVVPAPNMRAPNKPFSQYCFDPNKAQKALVTNYRELGKTYRDVQSTAKVNPAVGIDEGIDHVQFLPFNRVLGSLNMTMSGVTRDAAGAALGTCQVLIFRTESKELIAETTSDASGIWSLSILKGGPFFIVAYKNGTPVFGTSVNTLVPVQQ